MCPELSQHLSLNSDILSGLYSLLIRYRTGAPGAPNESDPLQSSLKIDSSKSNAREDPTWSSRGAPVQLDHCSAWSSTKALHGAPSKLCLELHQSSTWSSAR